MAYKQKYTKSSFPFKSPLHHNKDADGNVLEEHAHSEEASRSSRPYITVSGKKGSTMNIENVSGHSSTQGSYDELREKAEAAELAKILGKKKK